MSSELEDTWISIDDGTGRNVLYLSSRGERRRKEPPNFTPEALLNGRRRYYYRGACVRCKKKGPQIVLSIGPGLAAFSVNYCEECMLAVTPGVSRLRNNGSKIWEHIQDAPMTMHMETKSRFLDDDKHLRLIEVSKRAQYDIATSAKYRRNSYRYNKILNLRDLYGIKLGEHISWGFDNNAFDEYFGELNAYRLPHGQGVRFYSDGSVYCGGFVDGLPHCDSNGILKRPNGAEYEGSWVNGFKHGMGQQTHPDGSIYVGEFAKGFEHGTGELTKKDGSIFQGKFRYGRKDGQGMLISPDGIKSKGVFRDADGYTEKPPPIIREEILDDETLNQPPTLSSLAITALATVMHTHRQLYPSKRVSKRLFSYMKPIVTRKYLDYITPAGAAEFASIIEKSAMMSYTNLRFESMKLISTDIETLVYFENSNPNLKELVIRSSKIKAYGVDLIAQQIERGIWPKLRIFDLSLNIIEYTTMQTLSEGNVCTLFYATFYIFLYLAYTYIRPKIV